MNTFGLLVMKSLRNLVLLSAFLFVSSAAHAEDLLGYLIDSSAKYSGPSLEDNVVLMDTDKNGFADVFEVRAFLELKHGKGYEKELLDKWESSASGKSCSTPFAKDLYGDQTTSVRTN
jgi:hypothetical protein